MSEITLRQAIEKADAFAPVKIIFNGVILYDDYDCEIEVEPGVAGETQSPLNVIPNRLWGFENYIVTSLNIEIVDYHHSILMISGEFKAEE